MTAGAARIKDKNPQRTGEIIMAIASKGAKVRAIKPKTYAERQNSMKPSSVSNASEQRNSFTRMTGAAAAAARGHSAKLPHANKAVKVRKSK